MECLIINRRKRHAFFFEKCERKIYTDYDPVVVCHLCFGWTDRHCWIIS
jgi:hypothetical protein